MTHFELSFTLDQGHCPLQSLPIRYTHGPQGHEFIMPFAQKGELIRDLEGKFVFFDTDEDGHLLMRGKRAIDARTGAKGMRYFYKGNFDDFCNKIAQEGYAELTLVQPTLDYYYFN
jgi:hypothetical protein